MKQYGYLTYVFTRDIDLDAKLPTRVQAYKILRNALAEEFGGTSKLFKPLIYPNGEKMYVYRSTMGYLFIADFYIPGHFYDGLKDEYKKKLRDLAEGLPILPFGQDCPLCGKD